MKIFYFQSNLEFDFERDMLMTDALPKLQQYFLTQGIYVEFIDCNLNWHYDLSRNPYHVLRYMRELEDAHRTSTGLFLLVRNKSQTMIKLGIQIDFLFFSQTFLGNKYGPVVLPIELSPVDFGNIKTSAAELNKGKQGQKKKHLQILFLLKNDRVLIVDRCETIGTMVSIRR